MITFLLAAMMLHPGHMTRVEIRIGDDHRVLEIAMRIDAADMESALKRRDKTAVDIESLSDADAERLIGKYLRDTVIIANAKIAIERFQWVGWQKGKRHLWAYFEITLPKASNNQPNQLFLKTLFDVEPELQHIVVLTDRNSSRTVIITKPDQPLTIPNRLRP